MPTYEYECEACGHHFELFQKMGSAPKRTCPECKRRKVKRLIGAVGGNLFKGAGLYETDYRSDAYKKAAQAESESASSSSGDSKKSDKKSDSSASSNTSSKKSDAKGSS